jgi:PTH1 family peptidyl-tRNA hydrolase
MNRSGKAVRYWLQQEKIEKSHLLVILDDLNLPLGKLRLRGKGSDGGHNGLKDIDQLTGGNDYARLRLGIGNDFPKGRQADYVLSGWTAEERAALPELLKKAAEAVKAFGTIGLQHAMNQFNN